jgi:hypothetical protein
MRGAIGNAEWRGPKVSDVLTMAGVDRSAAFMETDGADTGVASTPDFVRSLPMNKALHPSTILALSMNGQTPDIHGFPVRLIVPGWDATSSVKWVVRISAAAQASTGFFMNPGYRYPRYALPPGTPARPAELEVIEGMPVKSSITAPEDQEKIALGPVTLRGFAWAGAMRNFPRKNCPSPGDCGAGIGAPAIPATTPSCRALPIRPGGCSPSCRRGTLRAICGTPWTAWESSWRKAHENADADEGLAGSSGASTP